MCLIACSSSSIQSLDAIMLRSVVARTAIGQHAMARAVHAAASPHSLFQPVIAWQEPRQGEVCSHMHLATCSRPAASPVVRWRQAPMPPSAGATAWSAAHGARRGCSTASAASSEGASVTHISETQSLLRRPGAEIHLIGTAHISKESAEEASIRRGWGHRRRAEVARLHPMRCH